MSNTCSRRLQTRSTRGFTLLEILVVLVIIGMIAGLVGPRLFTRVDASRVQTADTQVQMLRGALETYRLDMGRFPTTEQGLDALYYRPSEGQASGSWTGPYIDEPAPDDPWNAPYQYRREASVHGLPFVLYSFGANGELGGEGNDADVGYLPAS
jgi:general secretion pathway protein G